MVMIIVLIVVLSLIGVNVNRPCTYEKEALFDYMKGFLDSYPLSELMTVLTDVIETIEWEKAENERFN